MTRERFDLLLFHRDMPSSCQYLDAGVDGIIVDLESDSKAERQLGFDTQINDHSIADLRALRGLTKRHLLCRLSGPDATESEIATVIEAGADEVIVPMLTGERQAARICGLVGTACAVMLMVETDAAAKAIASFNALPVKRIYVGLNDLHISRKTASIFAPLADGLLERLRRGTTGPGFGFGGLTLPGLGAPLPVSHLYNEMARLEAGFTFLRRSFYRDTDGIAPTEALARVRAGMAAARARSAAQVEAELMAMRTAVQGLMVAAEHD
jgi:hypothetical protein